MVSLPTENAAFLVNDSGVITSWSIACERLLRMPRQAAIGHSLMTLLVNEDMPARTTQAPAQQHEAPGKAGSAAELAQEAAAVARALADPALLWRGLAADHQRTNAVLLRRGDGGLVKANLALAPQYDFDGNITVWVAAIDNVHDDTTPESVLVGRSPLAAVVDVLPGTFYALNRAGRFVLWNHNHERVAGLNAEEMAATGALELFDLATRPRVAAAIEQVFEHGQEVEFEADVLSRHGHSTPMLLCGSLVRCNGGAYLFGMGLDIARRRAQEQHLRVRERALHAASNGIVIARIDGANCPIDYVNPAFERITGYSAQETIGRDVRFMAAPGVDGNERQRVQEAVAARHAVNVVFRTQRKNGELFWNDLSMTPVLDEQGGATHFIGILVDVTASRQRTALLEHEVNHDALTGLANRNLLWDRLDQALHLAQRQKSQVGVVLIDLDNFKNINDSFGHEAGDVVLKVVARRLLASVRDSDTVARLSGDEFVVALVNQPSLRFTLRMIERLRQSLTQPVSFMHKEIAVGASLGVAVYPHDGVTARELVRSADVAMYHAKANGRNELYFFSNDMKSSSEARQRLDAGMAQALERDELFLLYQPCVDARSGKLAGFEALLRWRHPERGVLLPAAFLPEAEENGRIIEFGAWVLDQACAFLGTLKGVGATDVPVTVNVSAREYGQQDFVSSIAARLDACELAPTSLQIELREDTMIKHPNQVRDLALQLKELGLTLSIDGFGQGVSDLGFLKELSVGQLKLSAEAVHAIDAEETDAEGSTLARTLIDIGHNLHLPVIGEAVETPAQRAFLTARGCTALQGALLSAPMLPEAARELARGHVAA